MLIQFDLDQIIAAQFCLFLTCMKKVVSWYQNLPEFVKNRYVLAMIAFVIWMTFFDMARFPVLYEKAKEKETLLEEKEEYSEKIRENYRLLEQLNDSVFLEQYAREKYLMKKADEDLFVIVDSTKVDE